FGAQIVESAAPARPEVPGVRTGVDGPDGTAERMPSAEATLPAAPDPGDAELGLEVDETGLGGCSRRPP
nr:hypothetical protein [Actinomycetota bacterium]